MNRNGPITTQSTHKTNTHTTNYTIQKNLHCIINSHSFIQLISYIIPLIATKYIYMKLVIMGD